MARLVLSFASRLSLIAAVLVTLSACGGGGGSSGRGGTINTGDAQLSLVEYGRLVDVFGLKTTPEGVIVELYDDPRTEGLDDGLDIVIGPDIQDERGPTSTLRDDEVLYDFLGANPDTLQPRLLITREIGSPEFREAFAKLDDKLRPVAGGLFGQDINQRPFSVVPRNAAFRLKFSQALGVHDDFFVQRDAEGRVTGLKNTEAVQLLEIADDPRDDDHTRDYRAVHARIIVRGDEIVLDPVLLGTEGLRFEAQNNAAGLPESPDQLGANIRLAIALEGPLSIPGVHDKPGSVFVGRNLDGHRSIVRDFRSGNRNDNSPDIARGFVRESEPPRIVGELLFFVEGVDRLNENNQVVTIYKNGRDHEIDRGDALRFLDPATNEVLGTSDVVLEPEDDLGEPGVQHVRCVIRTIPGLSRIDPRNHAGYPSDRRQREVWLRENGPRVVLVSEFASSRIHPVTGEEYGDDPANFLVFSPSPLPLENGDPSPATENVSPFASAVIRFTKPVDMTTVRAFDSFFFATRNVFDDAIITRDFLEPNNIDPESFNKDKFITPHMIVSRVIDEDGSQTSIRLQPTKGLYLDQEMRDADEGRPFAEKQFRYYLHLLGGTEGIRDLSGNGIDLQTQGNVTDFLVIPFSLDTRARQNGDPAYADNHVVSIVRRLAIEDEDEQPSYYLDGEFERRGQQPGPEAFALQDMFGAVQYLSDGSISGRLTSRVRKVVDDINQRQPPPASSEQRFCPTGHQIRASAEFRFGAGIQNPLNPYGSRLQACWREIDLSLSRTDADDFNLDLEQLWWGPFFESSITYDVFDRVSLFLGHSEWRPEPCLQFIPSMADSGLFTVYARNYAHNISTSGGFEDQPEPHVAYQDQQLVIDSSMAITERQNVNRFLPLPAFEKPYFVWRDERLKTQGGASDESSDMRAGRRSWNAYIISPWLGGGGRYTGIDQMGNPVFLRGRWGNYQDFKFRATSVDDRLTGGGLATIALPLLADFWTYCDDSELPEGNGFIATGFNGWQIALATQTNPWPNFRAYSGGFAGFQSRPSICIGPADRAWSQASGGFTPTGNRTQNVADNSVYWIMADFLKRQTVATAGFVDLLNPHRMPTRTPGTGDPRLGPYFVDGAGESRLPQGVIPRYDWTSEPALDLLPSGTSIVPEFRAASRVDPNPWRWREERMNEFRKPSEINFPLDPLKACDAHIRKFDDRLVAGQSRDYWAYFYNRQVTDYTTDIDDLSRDEFITGFVGPHERFGVDDVRYFNWRFIFSNNVDASPAVSPVLESFAVSYRFEPR